MDVVAACSEHRCLAFFGFVVLTLVRCCPTFAAVTRPRLEICRLDQSTLGKDTSHSRAGSACDQGTW
jgi:hypothetical protein